MFFFLHLLRRTKFCSNWRRIRKAAQALYKINKIFSSNKYTFLFHSKESSSHIKNSLNSVKVLFGKGKKKILVFFWITDLSVSPSSRSTQPSEHLLQFTSHVFLYILCAPYFELMIFHTMFVSFFSPST